MKVIDLGEVIECIFIRRENRFVGRAICGSQETIVHINNTGRLLDVLYGGSRILCTRIEGRKTKLRVIGSYVDGDMWTLIDTKMQERAFVASVEKNLIEWLEGYKVYKRDVEIKGTKIDFLLRRSDREALVELKSAVYFHSSDMSARYPDTISLRGRRHIEILSELEGRDRYLVFIAGHPLARIFGPSSVDPLLPSLLRKASMAGIYIKAIKFYIDNNSIVLSDPNLPVTLDPPA